MGNVVEAYDLSIYYFLSSELSRFLIGDDEGKPTIVLMLVFFAYLVKPIGAFVLGLLSDMIGRKRVLTGSILIMGLSTALIGLIPGYDQIGLMAAGLLLTLRMIQNMALGSEFLNSASFLVESGDIKQRGFRGCWPSVGVKAGYLIATLIVAFTHHYGLSWRVPFLLAAFTTIAGLYVRYSMPESLGYVLYYADRKKPTTRSIYKQSIQFMKQHPFLFNYAFVASFISVATNFFYYLYIPMHAMRYSQIPQAFIQMAAIVSLVFVGLLIPVFGWLSDKCDRLTMLVFAVTGLFVLSYPFMHAINTNNATYFLVMQLLISIPCACYYSVSSVIMIELFPLQIRCTALSLVFSVAASIAAGVPPLLSDYLARATNMPDSPSLIIMVITAIMLFNILWLRQRYRVGINQYASMESPNGEGQWV